jgi:hypothetical protein
LGHNSKAVHRAYAKYAEVTVPSLGEWEKEWEKSSQLNAEAKLLPVDFWSQSVSTGMEAVSKLKLEKIR